MQSYGASSGGGRALQIGGGGGREGRKAELREVRYKRKSGVVAWENCHAVVKDVERVERGHAFTRSKQTTLHHVTHVLCFLPPPTSRAHKRVNNTRSGGSVV